MNEVNGSTARRTAVCAVAFAFGAASILLGNWLESLAEAGALSSFPYRFGVVGRCSWIAPCIVLMGLTLSSAFEAVVWKKNSSVKWDVLKGWLVGFVAFIVGLIAGGAFLSAR